MKTVKIFLPNQYFSINDQELKDPINLYGTIITNVNDISFYIISNSLKNLNNTSFDLAHIGQIVPELHNNKENAKCSNDKKEFVSFTKSVDKSILLNEINFQVKLLEQPIKIYIIVYDKLHPSFSLICDTKTGDGFKKKYVTKNNFILSAFLFLFLKIISLLSSFTRMIVCLLYPIISKTAVANHFSYWSTFWNQSSLKRDKVYTIIFDIVAGISIMIWLFYLQNPSYYLLNFTEIIVEKLRQLLDSLKGSPVGLKLNVELNNFFLGCFMYHIDLWSIFLVIVSPVIQYLYIPLAILGCFGLSFQFALLCDLLHLISLHAHCFYIYAAVLYHIELTGIAALWRVIRGRRFNPLKKRVESHEYSNSQLYLATLFFAALLFLMPTIIIYYTVFASLRFCLYCVTFFLVILQKRLLTIPVLDCFKTLFKYFQNDGNLEMKYLQIPSPKTRNITWPVSAFTIKTVPSPFTTDHQRLSHKNSDVELLSIDKFLIGLITSNIMGFIQPIYIPNKVN